MAAAVKLCAAILALPAVSGLILTDDQKLCCAGTAGTAGTISKEIPGGGNYASPYASGKMKADGTCGVFNEDVGYNSANPVIAEPRTRFGVPVQCRTIGMYQEEPWDDAGCQEACRVCTDCDLAADPDAQDPDKSLNVDPLPCGVKMHSFDPFNLTNCKPNDEGWANIDMDSVTGGYEEIKNDADVATKISLTFKTKQGVPSEDGVCGRYCRDKGDQECPPSIKGVATSKAACDGADGDSTKCEWYVGGGCHDDEDLKKAAPNDDEPFRHGATVGSFEYQSLNKRYFLPCKQAAPLACMKHMCTDATGEDGSVLICPNKDSATTRADCDGANGDSTNCLWTVGEGTCVQKTIKVTVTRPADLTEFGGEWVKSYPKDSWQNVTNEYEPYTFNDYGSKIPLGQFRAVTVNSETGQKLHDNAPDATELNVFMEMSKDGDYEIRYGNPHLSYAHDPDVHGVSEAGWEPLGILQQHIKECALITDETTCNAHELDDITKCTYVVDKGCEVATPAEKRRWVAVEFKKSQLRVGSPWSQCGDGDAIEGASDYTQIGTIIPVYLGNPSLLIASYMGIRDTLTAAYTGDAATLKTKIILNIFTPTADSKGNDWHPSGWTDGGKSKFTKHCDRSWQEGHDVENNPACVDSTYDKCYSAGEPCPLDHSVCRKEYCELQRWREIIKAYKTIGTHVEVLGLIETKEKVDDTCEDPDGCCPTCTTKCCDRRQRDPDDIKADIKAYNDNVGDDSDDVVDDKGIDGFYFNEAHGDTDDLNELMTVRAQAAADDFVVFGNGQPLFEPGHTWETNAGKPDVWVTLHETSGKLGFWTPFSWFPSVDQDKWGAMVYNVHEDDVTESLEVLFDRGYGYVYLHSEKDYGSTSTHLSALITGIGAVSKSDKSLSSNIGNWKGPAPGSRRKLQEDDGITRRTWGCDETMMQCRPVCLESNGLITSIVQSKLCGDPSEDMDECSCPCYYDAYWTCAEDTVVCMATRTGQEGPSVVGDLICENRGTPKPVFTQEQRHAGACAKKPAAMGTTPPTSICLERAKRAKAVMKGAQPGEDMKWDLGNDLMASSVSIALAAVGMAMVA